MHPAAVRAIVTVCRQREREGDHPTVACPSIEALEGCVLELARQVERLLPPEPPPFRLLIDNETLVRQIAADPDGECEAGILHPEAPH